MSFELKSDDKILKLILKGEFNIYDVSDLRDKLLNLIKECSEIEIYPDTLTSIDTAGLQFLISLKKTCMEKKIELSFFNESGFENLDSIRGPYLKSFLDES